MNKFLNNKYVKYLLPRLAILALGFIVFSYVYNVQTST